MVQAGSLVSREGRTSRKRIAFVLAAQGKPAEAEAEYRQVLAAQMRILAPTTPAP
jgi:hypothetical protein